MHNPVLTSQRRTRHRSASRETRRTADSYGKVNPSHHKPGSDEDALAAVVLHWHKVALDAALQDFSTTTPEGEMASPEQPVATYQSRAMAIAHIAIYDAYVAVTGDAEPYSTLCDVPEFDCALPGMSCGCV